MGKAHISPHLVAAAPHLEYAHRYQQAWRNEGNKVKLDERLGLEDEGGESVLETD